MNIAGIIAEYNPFHNGHKFQIEKTREKGATHIIACMSGSFVQRGDIAVFDKWTRAQAAVDNGVDLVIEMPTIFSLSCANVFAKAGVYLLNQFGIDNLSFGAECDDILLLQQAANNLNIIENSDKMRLLLQDGISYPLAQTICMKEDFGEKYSQVITQPNNILAVEYLRAINAINPSIGAIAIKREQVLHDQKFAEKDIASASFVREIIKDDVKKIEMYVPKSAYENYCEQVKIHTAPIFQKDIEQALLYKLRMMSCDDFEALPDVGEGLQNRLYKCAMQATMVNEFFDMVKTKRYTHARIRRICYCALLDIKKFHQKLLPQYVRVLAANSRGIEILAKVKGKTEICVGTKFADLFDKKPFGIEVDVRATDIFALATNPIMPAKMDFTHNVIIK